MVSPKKYYSMKRKICQYAIYLVVAVALLSSASCKKEFLNVNNNENSPETVDVKYALPSAETYIGYTVANQLALVGGFWVQYWTQGPNANQYANLDQYVHNSAEADRPWRGLYSGALKDLQFMYETAQKDSTKKNYGAIARILQAYTYQVVTDAWGDVPFTEALKGDAPNPIIAPHYDSQERIYDSILVMVDEGQAMLDDSKAAPGTDDLIYSGDLSLWNKFANTLKLRILLRQSGVRPQVAQAGISALFASGASFLEEGDDAKLHYADKLFQYAPLYATEQALNTSSNIFASSTIADYLNNTEDVRANDFFDVNGSGSISGLAQGQGKLLGGNQSDATWSKPSDQIMGPTAATYLMTSWESYFLQAEAMVKGYGTGDAEQAYVNGITASWDNWENSSAAASDTFLTHYLSLSSIAFPTGGSVNDKLTAIWTQKWVAMTGNQNFEAWTEWRRTGVPSFQPSATSVLGSGVFPARMVYPSDEVTSNVNFPGIKTVDVKMWWDVN
jgi:hypothetical protein